MKKVISLVFTFLLMWTCTFAQDKVEMADTMRSNGRIYVVIAVIITILLGLILYIVRLDRKILKMEKNQRTS